MRAKARPAVAGPALQGQDPAEGRQPREAGVFALALRPESSFQIGDVAADGIGVIRSDDLASKHGTNRILQIVRGGGRTRAREVFIPIVDPAVISEFAG